MSEQHEPDPAVNRVDHRKEGGPLLEYLWCTGLQGQCLYLGGEVGSDGNVYFIPGHAKQVLRLEPKTDKLSLVGPIFQGKFKWLRGIVVGDIIYGLPCHADCVLKINSKTGEIGTIVIPYEECITDSAGSSAERHREWKYHGGNICPIDGCIYAIPQSALHVLKIDPRNDTCQLVGPALEGRWKWYGGVPGKQDGAIYGIPHNSPSVLRIHPEAITLHGDFSSGCSHQWHGASAAPDGTIVCVPANADTVLCIRPGNPPSLVEIGDDSIIRSGRHRNDKRYKYLGATTGTDGMVYVFPSGSEYVLQVDTELMVVANVGSNIVDHEMERLKQNKWQNGVLSENEQCVYGIPLAAETVLRIDCSSPGGPTVSTWPLPSPSGGLAKFEGGVVAPNGIIYTVPNNHKGVLRIQPSKWQSKAEQPSAVKKSKSRSPSNRDDPNLVYKSGIPTLRSSAHRVKFALSKRRHDPSPMSSSGSQTSTLWLPDQLLRARVIPNNSHINFLEPLQNLLARCDDDIVGSFTEGATRLENFKIPISSTWRVVNGGQCETAQIYLSEQVAADRAFLDAFNDFVTSFILPNIKNQLIESMVVKPTEKVTFYYQNPPTLRLQPGPAWAQVKPHNDAEYGHQNGELNFWLPFTDRNLTKVDLWCESAVNANDFAPVECETGEVIQFHGSSCRHYVNCNSTEYTRVSMDFRVGVQGFFDPFWQMQGTTDDHGRTECTL